jgi:hypothetical protein
VFSAKEITEMAEGELIMSRKERHRLLVMHDVKIKKFLLKEAAGQLGLSYRQTKRVWRRFRKWGAEGLVHEGRGRESNRRLPEGFKAKVLAAYEEYYKGYGPTKAAEKLWERDRLKVDHETLRRWLLSEGKWESGRKRRKHRRRRERRAHRGELVQLDGSPHKWHGDRAPASCLMVMVDDATGTSLAHMAESETIEAAFAVLEKWIRAYGVPKALYVDGKYSPREGMSKKELAERTNFARACEKLGIEIITAHSPQAKGRVERKNGVYQDHLVKELALAGISDIATTNRYLPKMDRYLNDRFAKQPADPEDWHRPLAPDEDLRDILCFEETRVLARDWTIRYYNRFFQIERQDPLPPSGCRITVRCRRDGTIVLLHKERALRFKEIPTRPIPPPKPKPPRRPRKPHRPAPDHPWRRGTFGRASQTAAPKTAPPRPPATIPTAPHQSPPSLPLGDVDAQHPHTKPSAKNKSRARSSAPASNPPPRRSGRSPALPYPPDG